MAIVRDFRNYRYEPHRIVRCGKHIGRHAYWKLYALENQLRLVIHSVLLVQIGPHWWDLAVDQKIRGRAERFRQQYVRRPMHALPGRHDIYFVFLSDLNNIIRANSNLFLPLVPDIDNWIVKIESVRLPRNIVGHMNFLNQFDRQQIDNTYNEIDSLVKQLERVGVAVEIP